MEISSTILALSLVIVSFGLNVAAAICWFPLWWLRDEKSGTAHALFLTALFLAIINALKIIQVICYIIGGSEGNITFNLAISFFALSVAVVQFALSRGYFNVRE